MIRAWLGIAAILLAVIGICLMTAVGAGPNGRKHPLNDPLLAEQWYLHAPGDEQGSPGSIDAVGAWEHIHPAKPIIVAIFDAGVNYGHPDLEANIWKNEREILNGKDDDGNGYADDVHGWDFTRARNDPLGRRSRAFPDQFDHGTAVAALVAAVPGNGIGIAGVGRNVRVMPLRVIGEPGQAGESHAGPGVTFPEGIRYAIRNGARVIVCTTPLTPAMHPENLIEAPLREAEAAGVLFVRSAGNAGRSVDEDEEYGLLSRFGNVLVVGGTARDGTVSRRVNFGMRVGIGAPCVDMVFPSFEGYDRSGGPATSFAAPIVAGAAATLLSQSPELRPPQVIARLRDASVPEPGMNGVIGGGRLNMRKLFGP
jgi:thermitase